MTKLFNKIEQSSVLRLIIYIVGVIFAAGVFYASQRSADASQAAIVAQHTVQIENINGSMMAGQRSMGEIRGAIDDLVKALAAEHELRLREEDKMDERIKYLERHRN